MGAADVSELRDVGRLLASLKEPEPPKGLKDAGKLLRHGPRPVEHGPQSAAQAGRARRSSGKGRMSIWRACRFSIAGPAMWRR